MYPHADRYPLADPDPLTTLNASAQAGFLTRALDPSVRCAVMAQRLAPFAAEASRIGRPLAASAMGAAELPAPIAAAQTVLDTENCS